MNRRVGVDSKVGHYEAGATKKKRNRDQELPKKSQPKHEWKLESCMEAGEVETDRPIHPSETPTYDRRPFADC